MLMRRNRDYRRFLIASSVTNLGDGVSVVAFPWLASLITRDPFMIALAAAAVRAPWLLFSLPFGVLLDRLDRLRVVYLTDLVRLGLTLLVVALIMAAPVLPLAADHPKEGVMIWTLIGLAFALGTAEVLRDNAAQVLLPAIVDEQDLESANGQLWTIENLTGQFLGAPLAGLLIALALPLPFLFDVASFAVAVLLILRIKPKNPPQFTPTKGMWKPLKQGLTWLVRTPLIFNLALLLGALNFIVMMSASILVLVAQERFGLGSAGYGVMMSIMAAGGAAGAIIGPWLAKRFATRRIILTVFLIFPIEFLVLAVTDSAIIASIVLFFEMASGMVWNVITVSLRQRRIPTELLGRVNSAYRFIGWGAIPLGALFSGAMIALLEPSLGRDMALRAPFLFAAAVSPLLFIFAAKRLNFDEM